MSVWSDIQKRSTGEEVSAEDFIRSKEELSNIILEKTQNGSGDLAEILKGLSSHIDLPEDEQLFDIEDKHRVLANEQRFLLQVSLILPFKLWDYKSIENILIDQKVRVIIDPNEPEREVPSDLLKEWDYWKMKEKENPEDAFARKMRKKIEDEIDEWASMILLGLYKPGEKVIILYPNNMRKIEGGKRMNELLVSTLVHEAMHAYFNRTPLNTIPYVYQLEEPMAEFGMLLYLNETHLTNYYNWAKIFVSSKKTCYRYGAALMDQYEREGVLLKTRKDLVVFKLVPNSLFDFSKRYCIYLNRSFFDKTNYMNQVPLIIVRDFCKKNYGITYSDLNRIFNSVKCYNKDDYPGMIVPKADVDAYEASLIARGKKPNTRVHKESITLKSGEIIFVTTEWVSTLGGNFWNFASIADTLGYNIVAYRHYS